MKQPAQSEQSSRILVVDDEDVVLRSVCKILRAEGLHAEGVSSAAEGLARLREAPFDLLLVDLMMPEMDGIELLAQVREAGLNIPALMITGYPTIRTAIRALALGAVGYVTKPFTRRELATPVLRALRQKRTEPVTPIKHGTPTGESTAAMPGTTVYLPNNSWARFRQDRTVEVGVEQTFFEACGELTGLELPPSGTLVDQGFGGITLTAAEAAHEVMMPLSGQVIELNADVAPGELSSAVWLVRLLPSLLGPELRNLVLRPA